MERILHYDFNQEYLFATSVIDETQTATFSRTGIILHVPREKIIAATSEDMRSHIGDHDSEGKARAKADELFKTYGLRSPEEILKEACFTPPFKISFFHFKSETTRLMRLIRESGLGLK